MSLLPWSRDLDRCSLPRAQTLVRAFYALVTYMATQVVPDFSGLTRERDLLALWPVAWLEWLPPGHGATVVCVAFLVMALVAAAAPGPRWVRVVLFVTLLQYVALRNSEGRISHSLHLPVLTALILIFLPRGWLEASADDRVTARQTALVIRAVQAVILLTYTMSGLGKLGASCYELWHGQISSFHPSGLQRVIAARLLETGSSSPAADWLLAQPSWLVWPLLPGVIYCQLGAIWAAFRPSLHRLWGVMLILFHLGNAFVLTIHFPYSIFMLSLFFLASPFAPVRFDVRQILTDLPLLSAILRVAFRRMTTPSQPVTKAPAGPESAHR